MRRVSVIVATLVLVTGCGWTTFRGDQARSGSNPFETGLDVANLATLVPGWTGPAVGALDSEIVVRGSRAYAATRTGLEVVDAATGAVQRTIPTAGGPYSAFAPIVTGGSGADGDLYANERWAYVSTHPTDGGSGGLTRVVDPTDGTVREALPDAGFAEVETDGRRFVAYERSSLCCGEAVSEVVGTRGADSFRVPGASGELMTDGTSVFVVTNGGLRVFPVAGCGAATCPAATWNAGLSPSGAAIGSHDAFVVSTDGAIAAFDRSGCGTPTCTPTWSAPAIGFGSAGIAIDGDRVIVTAGTQLAVYAEAGCGAATCTPLWTGTGGGFMSVPSVANHLVLTGSTDGSLRAWSTTGCGAATCVPAVTLPQGDTVGPVTIADRSLYFLFGATVSTDGQVRRLVLPAG